MSPRANRNLRTAAKTPVPHTHAGIFEEEKIGLKNASPAQILQQLLESKWTLDETDKDMIVMQHLFAYRLNGENRKLTSSLVIVGDDVNDTAMAKGVGLPLAIACKLILTGKIQLTGVLRPIQPEVYFPILKELEGLGIEFVEKVERESVLEKS